MQNDEAEDLWRWIELSLSDRGCFDGIDDDVMEELRAAQIAIIRERCPQLKGGPAVSPAL